MILLVEEIKHDILLLIRSPITAIKPNPSKDGVGLFELFGDKS